MWGFSVGMRFFCTRDRDLMFSSLPGKTDLSCLSEIQNGLLDHPVTGEMGSRVLGPGAEPCQRLQHSPHQVLFFWGALQPAVQP